MTKTLKVNYSIIENKKAMPIAYIENGIIKTTFRTVKENKGIFFVSLNNEKQIIAKSKKAYKGITTKIIVGKNAITTNELEKAEKKKAEKVNTKKAEKETTQKATNKKVKKVAEKIVIENEVNFPSIIIPANIKNLFGENVHNTIENIINQTVYGLNGYNFKGWNSLTGKFKDEKIQLFKDGMKALENIESEKTVKSDDTNISTFNQLQAIMITYFLSDITKRMIYKYVNLGMNYKKLDKRDENVKMYLFSYENSPSSMENENFEIEEIFNTLLVDSYEKTFSEKMFDETKNVFSSIYFRISNIIRKLKGKSVHRLIRELKNNDYETQTDFESMTNIFNDMSFLNSDEREIMNLIISGYSFKEIDIIKGQRMDRKVKSTRNKLESLSNMTIKEAKQEQKELVEKMKKAKKEMLERKKEEMKNIPTKEAGKIVKRYTIQSEYKTIVYTDKKLNKANIELIDTMDRMKKLFNSKAL